MQTADCGGGTHHLLCFATGNSQIPFWEFIHCQSLAESLCRMLSRILMILMSLRVISRVNLAFMIMSEITGTIHYLFSFC
jgi:hypothetical protein